jgi:hypothetical protein
VILQTHHGSGQRYGSPVDVALRQRGSGAYCGRIERLKCRYGPRHHGTPRRIRANDSRPNLPVPNLNVRALTAAVPCSPTSTTFRLRGVALRSCHHGLFSRIAVNPGNLGGDRHSGETTFGNT